MKNVIMKLIGHIIGHIIEHVYLQQGVYTLCLQQGVFCDSELFIFIDSLWFLYQRCKDVSQSDGVDLEKLA